MKQFSALLCLLMACSITSSVLAVETRCPDRSLKEIEQLLAQGEEQIQLVEYSAALSIFEKAELEMPCAAELVPAATLSRLFIFRGLTMFYLGNEDLAKVSFQRALAIDRELRWDSNWGLRAKETFLDARENYISQPAQQMRCPLLAPGVQVVLNGRELSQGETSALSPGVHFLQIRWGDGRWEGAFFTLSPGREIPLPVPKQAMAAIQEEGPGTTGTGSVANVASGEGRDGRSSGDAVGNNAIATYLSGAFASAGIVGAIVFGLNYRSTRTELQNSGQYYSDVDDPAKEALLTANRQAAIGADVSMAVAAVATGSTVYFFLRSKKSEDKSARVLLPWFTPDAAGLAFHSHF